MSDTSGAGARGRVRELTPDQVDTFREDLRYLMSEGGWKIGDLNRALGFNTGSGMLRNILYDKNNKVSTSRARFDAIRRIREENLKPGIILVEAPAAAPVRGKRGGGRRGAAADGLPMELSPEEGEEPTTRRRRSSAPVRTATDLIFDMAGAAPVVLLKTAATEFSAQQQADGTWKVTLNASCSTEQMSAWARQVMSEQLAPAALAAAAAPAATEAEELPAG